MNCQFSVRCEGRGNVASAVVRERGPCEVGGAFWQVASGLVAAISKCPTIVQNPWFGPKTAGEILASAAGLPLRLAKKTWHCPRRMLDASKPYTRANRMVRLVGVEPTTGKTPVDFKPTAYANFATAAPATRRLQHSMMLLTAIPWSSRRTPGAAAPIANAQPVGFA